MAPSTIQQRYACECYEGVKTHTLVSDVALIDVPNFIFSKIKLFPLVLGHCLTLFFIQAKVNSIVFFSFYLVNF